MPFGISDTNQRQTEGQSQCAWAATIPKALTHLAWEEVEQCIIDLVHNPNEIFFQKVFRKYLRVVCLQIILHGDPIHICLTYPIIISIQKTFGRQISVFLLPLGGTTRHDSVESGIYPLKIQSNML
jgi:hypothetical protein